MVLVGHAYSGALIAAVREDRVKSLVYIAALGPDESETSQSLQDKFDTTEIFQHIEVKDGRRGRMVFVHFAVEFRDEHDELVAAIERRFAGASGGEPPERTADLLRDMLRDLDR